MQAEVEAAIVDGNSDDEVLYTVIEITLAEVLHGRLLFPNPFEEPSFYRRHFKKWVKNAVDNKRERTAAFNEAVAMMNKRLK